MKLRLVLACALLAGPMGHSVLAAEADRGLVEQGRYLAKAADCISCHGSGFKGGDAIPSPIGNIYAANITPDKQTGIGSWTLAQFSDALRKGRAPDGNLYPAMPYTSYTGLNATQIQALYSYFMLDVVPVSNRPKETSLPFPFYRPLMIGWNALFLDEGHATGSHAVAGAVQERGRVLVEALGHCTACHTPRGALMQEESKRHLGGAMIAGWWAPNITPDKSGIGDWSDEQLARFLVTGHTEMAVAAGDMGEVVSNSLSQLTPQDIAAVTSYLRALPAVASVPKMETSRTDVAATPVKWVEQAGPTDWQALLGHDGVHGDILYRSACASCHGVDGKGSDDLKIPSLQRLSSVSGPQGATLVQVISHGVDRRVGDQHVLMPAFRDSLDNDQVASLANYVRQTFGGIHSQVTPAQVKTILSGKVGTPWLIQNAMWLALLAIFTSIVLLAAIAWRGTRWMRRQKARAG